MERGKGRFPPKSQVRGIRPHHTLKPFVRTFASIIPACLAVLLLLAPAGAAAPAAGLSGSLQVNLVAGESRVLLTKDVERVAVADPTVADVVVVSKAEVLVTGKAFGTTSLHIWEKGKRTQYEVRVHLTSSEMVSEFLGMLGLPGVRAVSVRGAVVLDGSVGHPTERVRAEELARAFFDRVVNLIPQPVPAPVTGQPVLPVADQVKTAIDEAGVTVTPAGDTLVLEGVVPDETSQKRAEAIAGGFGLKVLNLLRTASPGTGEALDRIVAGAVADPDVRVSLINGTTLLLEGEVADPLAKERAERIAQAYAGRVASLIRVRPAPAATDATLRRQLTEAISDPRVTVRVIGNSVVLEGQVATALEKLRAEQIAGAFGQKVVSLVEVTPPAKDVVAVQASDGTETIEERDRTFVERIRQAILDPSVEVRVIEGTVFLEGTVSSEYVRGRAGEIALAFGRKVVNLLRVTVADALRTGSSRDEDARLVSSIKEAVGRPSVAVRSVNGTIFLEGTLDGGADGEFERSRAEAVARAFGRTVVNLLQVPRPPPSPVASTPAVAGLEPLSTEEVREVERRVQAALGEDGIAVKLFGRTLFLEGEVLEDFYRTRAGEISRALWPAVANLVRVRQVQEDPPPTGRGEMGDSDLQASVKRAVADEAVRVVVLNGTVILEGRVGSDLSRTRAYEVARAFTQKVVNLIEVTLPRDESPSAQGRPDEAGAPPDGDQEKDLSNASNASNSPKVPNVSKEVPGEAPQDSLISEIASAIGNDSVRLRLLRDTVSLEGRVAREFDRHRALEIAKAFWPKVLNLLEVEPPEPPEPPAVPGQEAGASGPVPVVQGSPQAPAQPQGEVGKATQGEQAKAAQDEASGDAAQAEASRREAALREEALLREAREETRLAFLKALREPDVEAFLVGDVLVLDGRTSSADRRERAEKLARVYFPTTVNLITVTPPAPTPPPPPTEPPPKPQLDKLVAEAIGLDTVAVSLAGDQVVLRGTVKDEVELRRVVSLASAYSSKIVNLLEMLQPTQVLLRVQVVEVNRNAVKSLGVTWGSAAMEGAGLLPGTAFFTESFITGVLERTSLLMVQLETMIQEGQARLLAAPGLVGLSGQEASFLAGGEIPVVIPQDDKLKVEWKEYGVKLRAIPTVEANGEVTVKVMPEVSSLDWANGVRLNSVLLPAMKTRRAETSVRVSDGGTFVIGGLIQSQESVETHKIPLLGDLPVLGALFRSQKFVTGETELLLFVTPNVLRVSPPEPRKLLEPAAPLLPESAGSWGPGGGAR
ncbi:MAG: BON domain-containing protein [Firmicutes bacterium]|nr:BON domain-containing protein [Bacillota bacterium]